MRKLIPFLPVFCLGLTCCAGSKVPPYLDDSNTNSAIRQISSPKAHDISHIGFPRVGITESADIFRLAPNKDPKWYAKYDVIMYGAGDRTEPAQVQAMNPSGIWLRYFSPRAFQAGNSLSSRSMPFTSTGPVTDMKGQVFAGHWLYEPGAVITDPDGVSATAMSFHVDNPKRIALPKDDKSGKQVGAHAVLYDPPAGSFANAEHVLVSNVDPATRTVFLEKIDKSSSRALKSKARAHPKGSILALHVRGAVPAGASTFWSYNQSTVCPKDAAGKRLNEVMPEWLAANVGRGGDIDPATGLGEMTSIRQDGVLFDADVYWLSRNADFNNDLVLDGSCIIDGVNVWGKGLEQFYDNCRAAMPGQILVTGWVDSRGFTSANGVQLEDVSDTFHNKFDTFVNKYGVHMRWHKHAPAYTEVLIRTPTKAHPLGEKPPPEDNKKFRFALGVALLEDGFFIAGKNVVKQPSKRLGPNETMDLWFDEYAVDTIKGSPTFGQSIPNTEANQFSHKNRQSLIWKHRHWLGKPLGPRFRMVDGKAFAPERDLMRTLNGSFNQTIDGWKEENVKLSRESSGGYGGSGGLRVSKHVKYDKDVGGAKVNGPKLRLTAGKEYTISFMARSAEMREVRAGMGGSLQEFLIPTQWTRVITVAKAPKESDAQYLQFEVGRENTEIWLDDVHVFEGNANILRRDFENGIVVVNGTRQPRTVELGGNFQRIRGVGQDPINDGSRVTSVRIEPEDAAILVRL